MMDVRIVRMPVRQKSVAVLVGMRLSPVPAAPVGERAGVCPQSGDQLSLAALPAGLRRKGAFRRSSTRLMIRISRESGTCRKPILRT